MKNTKQKGKFTFFSYEYKKDHFLGVCLEFDLLAEGQTNTEAMQNIFNASINYLVVVIKNNLGDKLLNLTPDKKYLREYTKLLKKRVKTIEKIKKPKKEKGGTLIPWEKFFSSEDFRYNPKVLKDIKREAACV